MSEHTISRILVKTKKKKRKPPRRQFFIALLMVVWCIVFSLFDLGAAAYIDDTLLEKAFMVTCAMIMLVFLALWWERLISEWKIWRSDDDN